MPIYHDGFVQLLDFSRLLFFFQAEAGIRDWSVTGVQTCAFLISSRRRHTRLVSDWSSDVCSSDLPPIADGIPRETHAFALVFALRPEYDVKNFDQDVMLYLSKIGRASCRERVYISVVAVSLKKKKTRSVWGRVGHYRVPADSKKKA